MHFVVEDYKNNIFNMKSETTSNVNATRNISEPRKLIPKVKLSFGYDLPQNSMRVDPIQAKFQSFVEKFEKEPASYSKSFFSPQAPRQQPLKLAEEDILNKTQGLTDESVQSYRPRMQHYGKWYLPPDSFNRRFDALKNVVTSDQLDAR